MRPPVLGALARLAVVAALGLASTGWFTARNLRELRRGPDGARGALDPSLACDLVDDWVRGREVGVALSCEGALSVTGETARLVGVIEGAPERAFCLARVERWRVLRDEGAVPCFPEPPGGSALEVAAREQERVEQAAREALRARLARVAAALAATPRAPTRCPERVREAQAVPVPTIDEAVLRGAEEEASWSLLTSTGLVGAPGAEAMLRRWRGPQQWLGVLVTDERARPLVGAALPAEPLQQVGRYAGRLVLVDAAAGEVLCATRVAFQGAAALPPELVALPNGLAKVPSFGPPTQLRADAEFETRWLVELDEALARLAPSGALTALR